MQDRTQAVSNGDVAGKIPTAVASSRQVSSEAAPTSGKETTSLRESISVKVQSEANSEAFNTS